MTDENNQIKFFLYENWARTKTGQHTVTFWPGKLFNVRDVCIEESANYVGSES